MAEPICSPAEATATALRVTPATCPTDSATCVCTVCAATWISRASRLVSALEPATTSAEAPIRSTAARSAWIVLFSALPICPISSRVPTSTVVRRSPSATRLSASRIRRIGGTEER
ncbi:MAG TPA: hypothetical protein VK402_04735 [Blastococcus sp.]|nr:hypothetical protein [Blastococcus sp.]